MWKRFQAILKHAIFSRSRMPQPKIVTGYFLNRNWCHLLQALVILGHSLEMYYNIMCYFYL